MRRDEPPFPPDAVDLETTSSTSVFHSPHTSHLPAHRACSAPQFVQRKTLLALAMLGI
jgi:hypothetical protein